LALFYCAQCVVLFFRIIQNFFRIFKTLNPKKKMQKKKKRQEEKKGEKNSKKKAALSLSILVVVRRRRRRRFFGTRFATTTRERDGEMLQLWVDAGWFERFRAGGG
jgi:hypothetical protein